MVEQQIQTKRVIVPNENLEIAAYLAQPTGAGPYPAVIVVQEVFGVNAHIRDVTERIARLGYVAIAPAIYQRFAPDFETGYTPADLEIGRKYKQQTKAPELLSDIQATINYLKQQSQVKSSNIGCIGFCFGGHVAYLAATLPEIKATAAFYGAGVATNTPGGGSPTISQTSEIKGTIYTFFGMEDSSIPVAEVDQIEAELQKHRISHHVFRYDGAEHGFFCNQRASYNAEAAADAWEQVKQLFSTELAV